MRSLVAALLICFAGELHGRQDDTLPAVAVAVCGSVADRTAAAVSWWRHPTTGAGVVRCQHDPLPGWSESAWLIWDADPAIPTRVPMYGTGILTFAWIDCPGRLVAHVVTATHMGTTSDAIVEFSAGGGGGGRRRCSKVQFSIRHSIFPDKR